LILPRLGSFCTLRARRASFIDLCQPGAVRSRSAASQASENGRYSPAL